MTEYHGWIVIREHYKEDSDQLLESVLEQISMRITEFTTDHGGTHIRLEVANGMRRVSIFAAPNHKGYLWDALEALVNWIAKIAVGSYGLVYCLDDEDKSGDHDKFIVYCIKKGKVYIIKDTMLSPVIPEIEEYED